MVDRTLTSTSEGVPNEDVSTAIARIRAEYVACTTLPDDCVTDGIVLPGSPAEHWLSEHVEELRRWNIGRAVDVPGDRMAIAELTVAAAERVIARLCVVHDLPLVDRGPTDDPGDDIPYVNPLLSIMTQWDLRATDDGWRLADLEPIGHYPESETCAPPTG